MKNASTWFVDNPVAANLLMLIMLVGGFVSLLSMHKEEFPNIEPGIITINVPYLGAAPAEVEKAVCIRIEEAIEGIEGIDRMQSISNEGVCSVFIELASETDMTLARSQGSS